MKKQVITLITMMALLLMQTAEAADLDKVCQLKGQWKFTIDDDPAFAKPHFDDSEWDLIYAPASWESQGYVGYDGIAWYRKTVTIPKPYSDSRLYLSLGKIDDVNQVYFNGVLIGELGTFPPEYETAYDLPVLYPIPAELIRFNQENTLAVRVFDEKMDGGIVSGNLIIGFDSDEHLLAQNLSGTWKLSFKNYKGCRAIEYDDSDWHDIQVPASWESQGYNNYDGYAWYRKSFELSEQIAPQKLYLVLGKIDDKDKVYLNNVEIGEYRDMYNNPMCNRNHGDWQIRRAYKIPDKLLNAKGPNTIAVVVYDSGGIGGIHEGPVGIMTKEQYLAYVDKHRYDGDYYFGNTIFNFIINALVD
ncbi:MAG: beta galactosidase jelly roll domain-containing protein [Salinivirgaceae bacterium]